MESDLGRSFVAQAGSVISGGDLCAAWQTTEITLSTADPFDTIRVGPIKDNGATDAPHFVGIAQESAGVGSKVTILTKGIFRLRNGSGVAIAPGDGVVAWAKDGQSGDEICKQGANDLKAHGTALTPSNAEDEIVLVLLNL